MKKKLLPIIATVASLSAIAFVGCGNEHTHNYKWQSKDGNHWQECECGDKTTEAPHVDEKINATGADGKDELCDVCGADLHVHDYQWQSDAAEHWQVCECSDTTQKAAHVDVKNNETDAEGADGLCDACARAIHPVTYNMKGHGTAPATQHIGAGGSVVKPAEDPADEVGADGGLYEFKGWYKDEACTVAYDYENEKISAPTVIYAKWEENTTAGISRKQAHVLALGSANLKPAKKGEAVYYTYKAADEGRYTIDLFGLNSADGTYTTNLTGETKYGKDCAAQEVTVDLDADQSLYILYTYGGEGGAEVAVSPRVTETDDEPLPAGVFPDGEYSSANYTIEFKNQGKAVVYNGDNYVAKYIAGKFNRLYFVKSTTVNEVAHTETYVLTPNDNGSYSLTIELENTVTHVVNSSSHTLNYVVPQPPIALADIAGYYEPKANATNGMTELYIYQPDSVAATYILYKEENGSNAMYSDLLNATYDTAKNVLRVGERFSIRLKLAADDSVESLIIGNNEYVKKGEAGVAPPEELPLGDGDAEYEGATHKIRSEYGSQYLGDEYDSIKVLSYDEDSDKYSVEVNADDGFEKYIIVISADKKTITLYGEDGATLLDTLTKFEWVYHELPTQAGSLALTAEDFQKEHYCLYSVQEDGWYSLALPQGVTAYRNLNTNEAYLMDGAVEIESGEELYLVAGGGLAIYMDTPAAASVAVTCPDSPAGYSQGNPKALVNGSASLDIVPFVQEDPDNPVEVPEQQVYFTYTAPSAGTYLVRLTLGLGNVYDFDVNGEPYAGEIVLTEDDLTVNISASCSRNPRLLTINVSVYEDVTANATDLALSGTPENDSLTASASAATGGNYHIATTKNQDVTVTGNAAFSVRLQSGTLINAEAEDGKYTAAIPAGTDVYFKLESATQQTLTLSQVYEKGSMGYPIEVTLSGGTKEIEVAPGDYTCFTLAPGVYSFDCENEYVYIEHNESNVDNNTPFVVAEGDVLTYGYRMSGMSTEPATLTISEVAYVFSEEQAGTYNGTSSGEDFMGAYSYDLTLTFDRFGIGTYTVDDGNDKTQHDISVIDNKDGTYSFEYDGGSLTVMFTFDNGVLKLIDEDKGAEALAMQKEVVAEPVTYSGKDGEVDVRLTIDGNKVLLEVDMGSGYDIEAPNVEPTKEDDVYTFSTSFGDTCTYKINDDGTITFTHSFLNNGAECTLTKQA